MSRFVEDGFLRARRRRPLAAPMAVGTFPVRFPSVDDAGDTGWHVDMSFGTEDPDFMKWRITGASRDDCCRMATRA